MTWDSHLLTFIHGSFYSFHTILIHSNSVLSLLAFNSSVMMLWIVSCHTYSSLFPSSLINIMPHTFLSSFLQVWFFLSFHYPVLFKEAWVTCTPFSLSPPVPALSVSVSVSDTNRISSFNSSTSKCHLRRFGISNLHAMAWIRRPRYYRWTHIYLLLILDILSSSSISPSSQNCPSGIFDPPCALHLNLKGML